MLHTFCEPLEFLKTQLLIPEGLTCVNKAWEMRCDFFFFFFRRYVAWQQETEAEMGRLAVHLGGTVLGWGIGVLGVERC